MGSLQVEDEFGNIMLRTQNLWMGTIWCHPSFRFIFDGNTNEFVSRAPYPQWN